jgi:hypothetical protein
MNARWLCSCICTAQRLFPAFLELDQLPICDARELFVGVSGMNFAGHMSLERGIHFALFCRRDGSVSIVTKLLQEPFDGTGAAKRNVPANWHSAC